MLLLAAGESNAQSSSSKPPVPPGRDPGGVAVAYIGPGVDYITREIAPRLARDGEGEIIGWDFVDNDRRPMDPCGRRDRRVIGCDGTLQAHWLLTEASECRLVVVRATSDQPQSLIQAVMFVAQSPARIVLLAPEGSEPLDPAFVAGAARRFPRVLFVAPQSAPRVETQSPRGASVDNLIFVADSQADPPLPGADLVVPAPLLKVPMSRGGPITVHPHVPAARVAALAARLLAAEPNLEAAALKRRIVGLAAPLPAGSRLQSRYGLIEHPDRPFRPQ